MSQIVIAEIEVYDPSIPGIKTLRYATQGYVTSGRNDFLYSEDFSNADWTKSDVTLTAGQTSPVNTPTAFVINDASVNFGFIQKAGFAYTSNTLLCLSWYVKKDAIGRATRFPSMRLSFGVAAASGRADISFDTSTGESSASATNGTGTTTLVSSGVVSQGTYWRVYLLARNSSATTSNAALFPASGASATWVASATATGSVTAWGAQIEKTALGLYTQTVGVSAPDFYYYEGRIQQPANIKREMFANSRTFGRSQIGYGDMVLVNNDGGLDDLLSYSFAGRAITIKLGNVLPASKNLPQWVTVLRGTMEQAELSWQAVTIRVRDRQLDLAKPLQQTRFLGTGNMEGGDDLLGKAKPLVFGKVLNIAPPLVDTTRNIFQVHDAGLVVSVDGVYDRGVALTAGAVYTSLADIQATAPAANQYRVWNSATAGCYIRLGSTPTGTITLDATQGATRSVGALFNSILTKAGVSSSDISASDITALNAAVSYECGVYCDWQRDFSPLEILDELCASVGAWYGADASGVFRIGRIEIPVGTEVGTITATELLKIERVASKDPGVGIPAWRVKVGYQKIYNVQKDLPNTVTAARRALLATAYRQNEASDAAVKTANLLSPELEFKTVLSSKTDALAEAGRLLAIYKVKRDLYQITIRVDPDLASIIDIGKIVKLQVNRFGMNAGKKFLIVGLRTNLRGYQFELTLWG